MKRFTKIFIFLFLVSCGVQDSEDQRDGISDSDHRVFVTSSTFTGNLGGLAGADSKCAQAASDAGLSRSYKAILSSVASNAESRLNITGGIFLFTDKNTRILVAASGVELWGTSVDSLKNAINRSETYALIADRVWTGTDNEGAVYFTDTCSDWAVTTGSALYGDSSRVSSEWTEDNLDSCSNQNHLYCISTSN